MISSLCVIVILLDIILIHPHFHSFSVYSSGQILILLMENLVTCVYIYIYSYLSISLSLYIGKSSTCSYLVVMSNRFQSLEPIASSCDSHDGHRSVQGKPWLSMVEQVRYWVTDVSGVTGGMQEY